MDRQASIGDRLTTLIIMSKEHDSPCSTASPQIQHLLVFIIGVAVLQMKGGIFHHCCLSAHLQGLNLGDGDALHWLGVVGCCLGDASFNLCLLLVADFAEKLSNKRTVLMRV